MSHKSRALRIASAQALVAGIQKHLSSASLTIGNTTYASANIVTMLQGQVAADNAVIAAEAAFHEAVAQDQNPTVAGFLVKLVQTLRIMYAGSPAMLADFGVAPPKPRVITPEVKVLAAAKAKATRKARNTMGSVQKKEVTGTVASVTVTETGTSVTPASPPAEPAPAPPATASNGASGTSAAGH